MKLPKLKRSARRLIGLPRRRVRAAGFGIHSPFAFGFVRDVIRCRLAYYNYEAIDAIAGRCGIRKSALRLAFRIASRFDCRLMLAKIGRAHV